MGTTVSRRAFLRNAAAGMAGAAALGIVGTALAEEVAAAPEGEMPEGEMPEGDMSAEGMPGGGGGGAPQFSPENALGYDPADYPDPASWRTAPDPIPDDQIVAECTADVVIVGHGHYGINCARYLCENSDKSVILIEQQAEDTLSVLGHEWTQLNSQFGFDHGGLEEIDPVEFHQNWMLMASNMCNPGLIMNYARYSGAATDQFLQDLSDDEIAASPTATTTTRTSCSTRWGRSSSTSRASPPAAAPPSRRSTRTTARPARPRAPSSSSA